MNDGTEGAKPVAVASMEGLGHNDEVLDDLYFRLHSLSKSLEGSGRIDEHENPDAYATVLDAMNAVRLTCDLRRVAVPIPDGPLGGKWKFEQFDMTKTMVATEPNGVEHLLRLDELGSYGAQRLFARMAAFLVA